MLHLNAGDLCSMNKSEVEKLLIKLFSTGNIFYASRSFESSFRIFLMQN